MTGTESWKTKTLIMRGGTRLDLEPVYRDAAFPGSLVDSKNFESGQAGGYKRILGYDFYDSTQVPGTGRVLGCFVYNNGVLACRGASIYFSTGSGWGSDIAPTARTGASEYRCAKYRWTTGNFITLVDGVNAPVRFNGTTGTNLAAAPVGATCVIEYKSYLCFGKGGTLTISDPEDDTAYPNAYPIGDEITGFGKWRGTLFIFCKNSIHSLSGEDPATFVRSPVTQNIGCTLPDTIQDVGGNLIFLASDGLRTIQSTLNSTEVAIDNLSNPIQQYVDEVVPLYHTAGRVCSAVVNGKSQYRLFFSQSAVAATDTPSINACMKPGAQGVEWEFFKLEGIQASCADQGVVDSVDDLIVHGDYSGYVYQQEEGNNFAGSDIDAYIFLPYSVFDDPAVRKTIYKLRLYAEVDGGAIAEITAQVYIDDDDAIVIQPDPIDMTTNVFPSTAVYGFSGSTYGVAVYGQRASANYRTQLIGSGYNIALKIYSNNQLPAYAIKTLIIEYGLGARQ